MSVISGLGNLGAPPLLYSSYCNLFINKQANKLAMRWVQQIQPMRASFFGRAERGGGRSAYW